MLGLFVLAERMEAIESLFFAASTGIGERLAAIITGVRAARVKLATLWPRQQTGYLTAQFNPLNFSIPRLVRFGVTLSF